MPDPIQRSLALGLSILSAPLVLILAALIAVDDPGWPFFVSERVGRNGRLFRLVKLRSMRMREGLSVSGITLHNDRRITRIGSMLRRTRLDELPQLWNVVIGEMRLVGPRPEDPRFVDSDNSLHETVFSAVPGITGLSQLLFVDESADLDPQDPEGSYRARVLPKKVLIDAGYLRNRSIALDLWILSQTVLTLAGRPPSRAQVMARIGAKPGDSITNPMR